jgi:hypothetical protein
MAVRDAADRAVRLAGFLSQEGAGHDKFAASEQLLEKLNAFAEVLRGPLEACEHIAGTGPQPRHAALFYPGRILCAGCVGKGGWRLDEETDRSCDLCTTVMPNGVRPVVFAQGIWIIHAGICTPCVEIMERVS